MFALTRGQKYMRALRARVVVGEGGGGSQNFSAAGTKSSL